jgi:hypothetical protein
MKYMLITIILSVLLFACVGKESLGIDKIPPEKPTMIQHIGDSGDTYNGITNYSFYQNTEFEENGIDAVSDGDKIKIEWEHLLDTDIDYLRIHRFSEQAYLADSLDFTTIVDSFPYTGTDYYKDDFRDEYHVTDKNWFYFIEAFDTSGNSTLSDTVCYRLLEKPGIYTPSDFAEYESIQDVHFVWEQSGAQYYKILLFNEDREILWSYRPLDLEDTNIQYNGANLPSGEYIFRIDSFGYPLISTPINGKIYSIPAGAESEERVISIL